MKTIVRHLPFTDKTEWLWPDEDEKLVQVFDDVCDIDIIMSHVDQTRVCVQAGGACGVWPLRYSQLFDWVYTFEPMRENMECLARNIEGVKNIKSYGNALSDNQETGSMAFDRSEHNNYGAVYFKPGRGSVVTEKIDGLNLDCCDLIQLDIEGYEPEALRGAIQTIEAFRPVIVLEEKPLPQFSSRDYKEARYFIEGLGYKEVGRIKKDVIFKC